MKGQILFVTDGSRSSQMAGRQAAELALAWNASVVGLFILDQSWGDLLGDEWISNAGTRNGFYRWLGKSLKADAEKVLSEFRQQAEELGVSVQTEIKTGRPEKVIVDTANSTGAALLVLPNPFYTRPPAEAGLKFDITRLARRVKCSILLGPGL